MNRFLAHVYITLWALGLGRLGQRIVATSRRLQDWWGLR